MIYKLSLLLTCGNSDLQREIDTQLSNIFNINSSKLTFDESKENPLCYYVTKFSELENWRNIWRSIHEGEYSFDLGNEGLKIIWNII